MIIIEIFSKIVTIMIAITIIIANEITITISITTKSCSSNYV